MNYAIVPIILYLTLFKSAIAQCFQDPNTNAEWAQIINGDSTSTEFSIEGTCCQEAVCGLKCAQETPPPAKVSRCTCTGFYRRLARHNATFPPPIQEYGKAVIASILFFVSVGFVSIFVIKGKSENYFVAGRSLPLWVRVLSNRVFKVVLFFTTNFILSR